MSVRYLLFAHTHWMAKPSLQSTLWAQNYTSSTPTPSITLQAPLKTWNCGTRVRQTTALCVIDSTQQCYLKLMYPVRVLPCYCAPIGWKDTGGEERIQVWKREKGTYKKPEVNLRAKPHLLEEANDRSLVYHEDDSLSTVNTDRLIGMVYTVVIYSDTLRTLRTNEFYNISRAMKRRALNTAMSAIMMSNWLLAENQFQLDPDEQTTVQLNVRPLKRCWKLQPGAASHRHQKELDSSRRELEDSKRTRELRWELVGLVFTATELLLHVYYRETPNSVFKIQLLCTYLERPIVW